MKQCDSDLALGHIDCNKVVHICADYACSLLVFCSETKQLYRAWKSEA